MERFAKNAISLAELKQRFVELGNLLSQQKRKVSKEKARVETLNQEYHSLKKLIESLEHYEVRKITREA